VQELRAERNDVLRRELLARWNRENRPGTEAAAEWALSDPDPTVILQAIEILKNRKTRSAAPAMMRVIEQNRRRPDGYGTAIREAAATALGACGNAAAVPLLLKELEGHDDLSYDVAVVKALGDIGEIAALPAVESQLRRLETLKPTEALALGPWRQAMETAQAARQKLSGTRADSP
jgi:HEAT repeat protein